MVKLILWRRSLTFPPPTCNWTYRSTSNDNWKQSKQNIRWAQISNWFSTHPQPIFRVRSIFHYHCFSIGLAWVHWLRRHMQPKFHYQCWFGMNLLVRYTRTACIWQSVLVWHESTGCVHACSMYFAVSVGLAWIYWLRTRVQPVFRSQCCFGMSTLVAYTRTACISLSMLVWHVYTGCVHAHSLYFAVNVGLAWIHWLRTRVQPVFRYQCWIGMSTLVAYTRTACISLSLYQCWFGMSTLVEYTRTSIFCCHCISVDLAWVHRLSIHIQPLGCFAISIGLSWVHSWLSTRVQPIFRYQCWFGMSTLVEYMRTAYMLFHYQYWFGTNSNIAAAQR